MSKDKLIIPLLGMLPSACAPDGFDSLEGFGELGDDGDDGDELDDGTDLNAGPFELESAVFEDLDTLVLSFSHPLAAFDEVDPASFRISLGFASRYFNPYYGNYNEITRYWDPNYINYYGYGSAFDAIALSPGPASEQLRVDFASPLNEYACALISDIEADPVEPPNSREIGLFVHYRAGDIPLRDTFDTDLPATGPDWVEWPYAYSYVPGPMFTYLDPKIEIPCP